MQVGAGVTTGVTAQLKFTVSLNEPEAVMVKVKLALCPALIVWEVVDPAEIEKSGGAWTVSDKATLWLSDPEFA